MSTVTASSFRPFRMPVYASVPKTTDLTEKEELHQALVLQLDRPSTKALTSAPADVARKGTRVNTENTFGRRTDLYAHEGKFYARRMTLELDEVTREPSGEVKLQWYELKASDVTETAFPAPKRSVLDVDRFVVR